MSFFLPAMINCNILFRHNAVEVWNPQYVMPNIWRGFGLSFAQVSLPMQLDAGNHSSSSSSSSSSSTASSSIHTDAGRSLAPSCG
jgi:hypothetical protein